MTLDGVFDPEPGRWGLRGDPVVWRAMRDRLQHVAVPAAVADALSLVRRVFHDVVGADLDGGDPTGAGVADRVTLSHLDAGGMSGGVVDVAMWRNELLPLLDARLLALYAD